LRVVQDVYQALVREMDLYIPVVIPHPHNRPSTINVRGSANRRVPYVAKNNGKASQQWRLPCSARTECDGYLISLDLIPL
jgi:hypothetical protein